MKIMREGERGSPEGMEPPFIQHLPYLPRGFSGLGRAVTRPSAELDGYHVRIKLPIDSHHRAGNFSPHRQELIRKHSTSRHASVAMNNDTDARISVPSTSTAAAGEKPWEDLSVQKEYRI